MRVLPSRLLLVLVLFIGPVVLAHDVTITGTQSFSSLDGSSSDHDGVDNGIFTVSDGSLIVNGTVNCNDGLIGGPCPMTFTVSGNMTMNAGSALYAEDRLGTGSPASITLNVGGNLVVNGTSGPTVAPIVSTAALLTSVANGGNINVNVTGSTSVAAQATFDAGSFSGQAGRIAFNGGGQVSIDGKVYAGPSRTLSGLMGGILFGGGGLQKGGEIYVTSTTFVEPGVIIGTNASLVTQGEIQGTGPVTIDGCGVEINGLAASLSRMNTSSRVSVRSGKNITVDARDLGVAGATLGRKGNLRADGTLTGNAQNRGVDLFAGGNITILGPAPASSSANPISSSANVLTALADGGTIRIISLGGGVIASGRVADASATFTGGDGGVISVQSKTNASLDTAHLRAIGQYSIPTPSRAGGDITVRSHSGDVIWTNGNGDVRPVGSTSGLPPSQQGTITLTACGTVNTTGTTFPTNGVPTGVFPIVTTGACSPSAPSLPVGVAPLITCNTPPVANDTSATTNEDTTVTITLSGSDADGHSLTFTIVTPPAHGSLGPVISTGPTTATVNYTPALHYNGPDSFVFRANDGNGGTDDATASITVTPVNDPPTFLVGPTDVVFEDSGPRTVANWATAISPGPSDESAQTVSFTVTNDNNSLFSVQPAVAPNGTLTYTPASNAYGTASLTVTAQDNGGTANGGNDTSGPQTSNIIVTAINDEPSFVAGPSQNVDEDSGPHTVVGWATAISAGPNESSQNVTFVTSNDNNALFSAQPSVAPNGTLSYTPAANANGSAIVTVFITDDGGTANGGDDTSPSQTFTIMVNAVNDAPSFTSGGNVTVLEDSGAYSASWATSISAGPADESGQTVNFNASNDNNALFAVQPSISPTGVLTFTPAAHTYGSATVTVTLSDNGGTLNGGVDTTAPQTFVLNVTPVNDEPSFTSGGSVPVNEDSGPYSAAWATSISAGPNESSQNVTFVTSNDNNALFSAQPSVSPSGVLTFTPAADANGSATVTVYLTDDGGTANGGDDTSPSQTFVVTVNAVNDEPSFTNGGNVTVNEDSGAYSAAWATSISAGPADEGGQTLTFNVSNDNNALFASQPSISPGGVLTFTLATNAFGSATVTVTLSDNGGTANGGDDTSPAQTPIISVNAVNDEPTFTPGGNVAVNEDSGAFTATWATGISAGPNESGQTLTFNVSNDNNALFSVQPAIDASGVLTFAPAPNANGSATVSVFLMDNGGTANGGDDTSPTVTFTITVNAVNDAPSFNSGGNVNVNEDSGSYSAQWATSISAGPPDEAGQTLTFNVSNNTNPSLFAAGPTISATGVLTFTVASNVSGSADITVVLQDNGGIANGGVDTATAVTFTIFVDAVNDSPVNTVPGPQTVNEDNNLTFSGATAISVADADAAGNAIQVTLSASNGTVTLSTTVGLSFSVGDGTADATMTFTGTIVAINNALNGSHFSPTPNSFGSASVTVTSNDLGNTGAGGAQSDTDSIPITVNAVNDGPTAGNDAWATIGNTELRVDLGPGTTPHVADTTPSSRGVLDNDADTGEGDPIVVSAIVGCVDGVAPFDCVLPSGSRLSMQANGSFALTPAPGLAGSDSFVYTATDIPSAGTPASANGTVVITLFDRVWYVNGSAASGGDGTSSLPFDNFASINGTGGSGDDDSPGDTIFVHSSNVSGGIELEASQHLLGEGVGLSLNHNLNGNGAPTNLVAVGAQPNVTGGANAVSITSALPVEVRGLSLAGSLDAIDLTAGGGYGGSATLLISSNTIRSAGADGIDVNAGASGTPTITIQNNTWAALGPHVGNGIDIRSTLGGIRVDVSNNSGIVAGIHGILIDATGGGTITVIGFSGNSVDGNTGGTAVAVTNAVFDQVPGGAFNTVAGGNTSIGSSVNPVSFGIILTNVSGDLGFGVLDIYSDNGVALRASASGSGFGLGSTNGTISAVLGSAVDVTSVNCALVFSSVSSANSATSGVSMTNATGSFSAAGGSITNAVNADFLISGGNANVIYGGTITDDVGRLVDIANTTGGTKAFTGAITDGDDGDGTGIVLSSNTGSTVRFAGGVVLSTGASVAFSATGGGTIEVCDEYPCNAAGTGLLVNKISTTTGTSLNVANTTIGASHLEFRSISSNGAASAIVLNATGASGSLVVKGNGGLCTSPGSCTGGAILTSTSHAINLTNTLSPSFTRIAIQHSAGSGINGTAVTNFTLLDSFIDNSGTGGGPDESNVAFDVQVAGTETNLSGVVTITNNTLTNARYHGVRILNFNGTMSDLAITGNTITSSTAIVSSLGSGIHIQAIGSAATVSNITRANISDNTITNFPSDAGIEVKGGNNTAAGPGGTMGTPGSGTNIISITNNRIAGQSAVNRMGTLFIDVGVSGGNTGSRSQANFDISNNGTAANPLAHCRGIGIGVGNNGFATSTVATNGNHIVANNTVGAAGIGGGNGIVSTSSETPDMTWTINSNNVSQVDGNGILAVGRGVTGILKLKIQDNTVAAPLTGVRPGIRIDAGNAASVDDAVCLNISSNTSAGSGGTQGIGLRKQGTVPTTNDFGINGLPGGSTSTPNVEAYVNSLNPAGGGTLLISAASGFSTCSFP